MRSVILRSRPGRPWWQLTTRPATAVVLGVVSLLAAGAQVALLSSPTPWYQPVVAGFWAVVGLAFLGSAAGTRTRARRAAEARLRVPVDSLPFVPVPVRPARPRRREVAREDALDVGEPTEDLADAVQTAVTPVVTAVAPVAAVVPAVAPSGAGDAEPTEHAARGHRRSRSGERPTGLLNRHAVRAVRSVESASRGLPVVPAVTRRQRARRPRPRVRQRSRFPRARSRRRRSRRRPPGSAPTVRSHVPASRGRRSGSATGGSARGPTRTSARATTPPPVRAATPSSPRPRTGRCPASDVPPRARVRSAVPTRPAPGPPQPASTARSLATPCGRPAASPSVVGSAVVAGAPRSRAGRGRARHDRTA